jgi:hypothetical protein
MQEENHMRRAVVLMLSLALALTLAGPVSAARPARGVTVPPLPGLPTLLIANLTGAAERPGPGDPDGGGLAIVTINQAQGQLCYTVVVWNITLPATGSHIHLAPPDVPGPIVVPLANPGPGGLAQGCVSVEASLLANLAANPGAYYLNVHTVPDYAAGAVRGQLRNVFSFASPF